MGQSQRTRALGNRDPKPTPSGNQERVPMTIENEGKRDDIVSVGLHQRKNSIISRRIRRFGQVGPFFVRLKCLVVINKKQDIGPESGCSRTPVTRLCQIISIPVFNSHETTAEERSHPVPGRLTINHDLPARFALGFPGHRKVVENRFVTLLNVNIITKSSKDSKPGKPDEGPHRSI
jgi:hypothetical protein